MPIINGQYRPILTFPIAATTVPRNLWSRACLLLGYGFVETTGAATAEVDILDGNDANGALCSPIALLAGQSTRDNMPGEGVFLQSGPFLNVLSGSIRGAIWYLDATAVDLAQLPSYGV